MGKHLKLKKDRKRKAQRPKYADAALVSVRMVDAVKITGISRTKLYSLIREGALPTAKIGRATLLLIEDLRALVVSAKQ
jgi:hypothetical protein